MSAPRITRRAALARLGLGAAAAYVAPAVTGLSRAHASSDPTAPSPASPPSIVSPPSPASGPSRAGGGGGGGDGGTAVEVRPDECRVGGAGGQLSMPRNDYQRVQRAIRSGQAQPLNEVLRRTRAAHPGHPVRVTFSSRGAGYAYHVQIVTPSGEMVNVTVDAGSGAVLGARRC